jgi:hypothetical protein
MALFKPRTEVDPFTADDWREAVAAHAPGGQDVFSNESGEATIVAVVQADDPANLAGKLRSAKAFVLGYSWADDASPWKLHRVPPVSHPVWGTQFRGTSVAFEPLAPAGNPDNPSYEPYRTSDVAFDTLTRYTSYTAARMTVRFSPRPYYLYADDNAEFLSLGGYEYLRYMVTDFQPTLEILSTARDNVIWFTAGSANNPSGQPFKGEVGERVIRSDVTLTWSEVPHAFLFTAAGIPQKILDSLGRVGSAAFLGFNQQTLLLKAVRLERKMFPFFSDDGRAFHWTVSYHFAWTDPPAATGTDKGWRLFPWVNGASSGGPGWYPARRGRDATEAATGQTYLQEVSFADKLFVHVGA